MVDIVQGIGIIPSVTIDIPGTKYTPKFSSEISFEWFEPYKNYTDLIITGYVYVTFLWRMFIHLPSIINGVGGSVNSIESIGQHIDKK